KRSAETCPRFTVGPPTGENSISTLEFWRRHWLLGGFLLKVFFVSSSPLKIAVIPGDGTGPEVTAEALKVLAAVAKLEKFTYETQQFDWGGERYLKSGETLPVGGAEQLRKFDAIYLGAVGHPDVKPGILEKGLLLDLRF